MFTCGCIGPRLNVHLGLSSGGFCLWKVQIVVSAGTTTEYSLKRCVYVWKLLHAMLVWLGKRHC